MSNKTALGIIITLMVVIVGMFIGTIVLMSQASSLVNPDDCQTIRTTVIYQDNKEVKTFDYLDCKEK